MKKSALIAVMATTLLALNSSAHAHRPPSTVSEASLVPVVISVAAPVALLASGAAFTVLAVEGISTGTVWVLERASDGAQFSVEVSGAALNGAAVVAGATVMVVACSTGHILASGGRAVGFLPNERGRAMFHNERVTR
jgi:hypothetical protein